MNTSRLMVIVAVVAFALALVCAVGWIEDLNPLTPLSAGLALWAASNL